MALVNPALSGQVELSNLSLVQFQTALQDITQASSGAEDYSQAWQSLQALYGQGCSSPMVRPFMADISLPSIVGEPTEGDIQAASQVLREAASLGPIRRNDPIAQNTHPWAKLVAVRQGKRSLAYHVLDKRADVIGTFLGGCLKKTGKRVAIFFSHNRSQIFEISLGARRAGIGFTNFHSYLSGEDFMRRIQNSPYTVCFLDSESLLKIEPYLSLLHAQGKVIIDIHSHHPEVLSYGRLFDEIKRPPASTPDIRPPAYPGPVMYSSGTTGDPKLISVRATSHVGSQANRLFGIKEDDRNLVIGQLYHGGAYSWAKGHLNRGAQVVLTERSSLTLDPEEVLRTIQERKITNFWISPTWLQSLCLYMDEVQKPFSLPSLRAIFVGAAPFHPATKKMAVARFGPILWENYASTEFGLISVLDPKNLLVKPETVGKPAPGVGIEIRNDDHELLPSGQVGRIHVKNELTGREFHASDDYGLLDEDGFLSVLGRNVEKIVAGDRVLFPRTLENAVMEMPGVRDAHVLGVEQEGQTTLCIALVSKPGKRLEESAVLRFLQKRGELDLYSPLRVFFISSIPRAPYKVNVRVLREIICSLWTKKRT